MKSFLSIVLIGTIILISALLNAPEIQVNDNDNDDRVGVRIQSVELYPLVTN